VHLDDGLLERVERVQDGDRGVGQRTGVDDDARRLRARLMDPANDLVLGIALQEADMQSAGAGGARTVLFDVGQRFMAVDFRLALAEKVEVRTVQDVDLVSHLRALP
jgi:hypothetical protein